MTDLREESAKKVRRMDQLASENQAANDEISNLKQQLETAQTKYQEASLTISQLTQQKGENEQAMKAIQQKLKAKTENSD